MMEDKEIIDLYFARNEAAIFETENKYGRMLRFIAYNILKNVSDSEECENDTYHAAWNKIPPHTPHCLSAFLGRIARNIALNKYDYYTADKRNREFETVLSELEDIRSGRGAPELHLETRATADCINRFLRSKAYIKRIVFVRRYWHGDSVKKIAMDCGFSESKVKSMLMRMRNELKICLERNGIFV